MKKIIVMFLCFSLIYSFNKNDLLHQGFASNPRSYIVMDANTQRIISGSNYHTKSLVASTAKIMTAIVAIENGDLFDFVTITNEDVNIVGSKIYVQENDQMLLIDLIYGLMLRSGNDAANAISRTVFSGHEEFVGKMNEMAKIIGMRNSTFANASGLDEKEFNLSTAHDMALLTIYAMQNEIFREISSTKKHRTKSLNQQNFLWQNKHKLVLYYDEFISGKTGFTKKAGRILVSVGIKNDREIVKVTINDSNDWQNHRSYLEQVPVLREFRILETQVLKLLFDNEIRKINIEQNIYVALTTQESRRVNLTFYLDQLTSRMVLYLDDNQIFSRVFVV